MSSRKSQERAAKRTVLIADDEELLAQALGATLDQEGLEAIVTYDGDQALDTARKLHPDLILMDVMMPGMSGVEVCATLKQDPATASIPVVLITAMGEKQDRKAGFAAGAAEYLIKPFSPTELIALVNRLLTGQLVQPRRREPDLAAMAADQLVIYARELRELVEKEQSQRQALQASEERYRGLFEGVPVGLYRATSHGQIIDVNPALVQTLGFANRESLLGVNMADRFVNPEDRNRWLELMERGGPVQGFEMQWRRHDGTPIWVRANARAVRDRDGQILCYEGALEDISEHKRAEEQLRQQDRLAAVGQLAGGLAHDFNNVLMSITLYADLLLDQPSLPTELVPDVDSILDEAQEATRLVRQVLDFSRRSTMETRPVDLRALIQKDAEILRRVLPESIRLLLELGSDEYVVNADLGRLQQVVMNLAVNARDAMPNGGDLRIGLSQLEVRPGEEPPETGMDCGEWVCIDVSDTGTGISFEVMSHLFEPFFTTKPRGEGTGLGLAQVYGIVKQHGGYIGVKTKEGQGTSFRVYVPAYTGAVERLPEENTSTTSEGKGETVLLVEDEERVRDSSRRVLESQGYKVLTAANGRQALKVYQSTESVDLVLTDMVMPEMGGRELIRELRRINPCLKAVAITGYELTEDFRELKQSGHLGIVYKPLNGDSLAQVVRQALDGDEGP